jgi:hypothetical protein
MSGSVTSQARPHLSPLSYACIRSSSGSLAAVNRHLGWTARRSIYLIAFQVVPARRRSHRHRHRQLCHHWGCYLNLRVAYLRTREGLCQGSVSQPLWNGTTRFSLVSRCEGATLRHHVHRLRSTLYLGSNSIFGAGCTIVEDSHGRSALSTY